MRGLSAEVNLIRNFNSPNNTDYLWPLAGHLFHFSYVVLPIFGVSKIRGGSLSRLLFVL